MTEEKHSEHMLGDEQETQGSRTLTIWVDADSIPRDIRPFLRKRA